MLPRMSPRFANRVVWITGASSGIGESLARAFSAEGAAVILSARRQQRLQALHKALSHPDDALVLPLDVTDPAAVAQAAEAALAWRGGVDILVNNAGISHRSWIEDTDIETSRRVMEINYFAVVDLTHHILPSMLARSSGHIVNISSVAGFVSTPMRAAYAASKHAVRAYSDALRAEVSRRGVQVTVICPGYIRTDISHSALRGDGTPKGEHDQAILSGLDPDIAAQRILTGVHRSRRELYIGGREIWAIYLQRFFPGIGSLLLPYSAPE
ncbi:MAG: dehydrogenase/reductase SDR family protein 7B [Myxococcota bacterium]|jgi:dehydrogenase/reductase SDR family protein 7B